MLTTRAITLTTTSAERSMQSFHRGEEKMKPADFVEEVDD